MEDSGEPMVINSRLAYFPIVVKTHDRRLCSESNREMVFGEKKEVMLGYELAPARFENFKRQGIDVRVSIATTPGFIPRGGGMNEAARESTCSIT
jgi:hypothetical protein